MTKKCRPQSVVGLGIENLSLNHIPDLLESPSQRQSVRDRHDENDSITELPSGSVKLQHLVKGRPKKAKTRAPTRAMMCETMGEGIDHFFRTGSATPTTLTPLVSPTSEECSSLSFVDSPTMSRDDTMGKYGGAGNMTSGETTPILDERKTKLERGSPLLKGVNNWTPRSQSSDNLDKGSPALGRRSPLVRHQTDVNSVTRTVVDEDANHLSTPPPLPPKDPSLRSPSNDSIKNYDSSLMIPKTGNGFGSKPTRPWSMAGAHNGGENSHSELTKTTTDALDSGKILCLRFCGLYNFVLSSRRRLDRGTGTGRLDCRDQSGYIVGQHKWRRQYCRHNPGSGVGEEICQGLGRRTEQTRR